MAQYYRIVYQIIRLSYKSAAACTSRHYCRVRLLRIERVQLRYHFKSHFKRERELLERYCNNSEIVDLHTLLPFQYHLTEMIRLPEGSSVASLVNTFSLM